MLPYTEMRGQVLLSTVPVHRMCQTLLIVLTFWNAGLHPDEGSSALKYRACAQNVTDASHSSTFCDHAIDKVSIYHRIGGLVEAGSDAQPCFHRLREVGRLHYMSIYEARTRPKRRPWSGFGDRGRLKTQPVPALPPLFDDGSAGMLGYTQMRVHVLSGTAPARRI